MVSQLCNHKNELPLNIKREPMNPSLLTYMVLGRGFWLTDRWTDLKFVGEERKGACWESLRLIGFKTQIIRRITSIRVVEKEVWLQKRGAGTGMWSEWIHSSGQRWWPTGTLEMGRVGEGVLQLGDRTPRGELSGRSRWGLYNTEDHGRRWTRRPWKRKAFVKVLCRFSTWKQL